MTDTDTDTDTDINALVEIGRIELLALKKLAIISGALAQSLRDASAAREQRALTSVLVEVINRADVSMARAALKREDGT
jgi:hypothetical protein